jgi:hypothetical protein
LGRPDEGRGLDWIGSGRTGWGRDRRRQMRARPTSCTQGSHKQSARGSKPTSRIFSFLSSFVPPRLLVLAMDYSAVISKLRLVLASLARHTLPRRSAPTVVSSSPLALTRCARAAPRRGRSRRRRRPPLRARWVRGAGDVPILRLLGHVGEWGPYQTRANACVAFVTAVRHSSSVTQSRLLVRQ